jgi:hypothetical protein
MLTSLLARPASPRPPSVQVSSDWGFTEKMRGEAAALLERLEAWVEKQACGMEAARSPERLAQHFDSLLKVMDALYQVGGRWRWRWRQMGWRLVPVVLLGAGIAVPNEEGVLAALPPIPANPRPHPLTPPPRPLTPPRSRPPRAPRTCWWTSCARCLARWRATRWAWPSWRSGWRRWATAGTTSRRRSRRSRARWSPSRWAGWLAAARLVMEPGWRHACLDAWLADLGQLGRDCLQGA